MFSHTVLHLCSCSELFEIIVAWLNLVLPACDGVKKRGVLTQSKRYQRTKFHIYGHFYLSRKQLHAPQHKGHGLLPASAPTPCRLMSTATTPNIDLWLVPLPLPNHSESLYRSLLISSPVTAWAVWQPAECTIQQPSVLIGLMEAKVFLWHILTCSVR